jgi:hypothetical protein
MRDDATEVNICPTREAWTKKMRRSYQGNLRKRILAKGTEGQKVDIFFNNEAGPWQWSIEAHDEPELWLESFKGYDEAARFCWVMKWEIVGSRAMGDWPSSPGEDVDPQPRCPYCGTLNGCATGELVCRACGRPFHSYEIPNGVVYCTRK